MASLASPSVSKEFLTVFSFGIKINKLIKIKFFVINVNMKN